MVVTVTWLGTCTCDILHFFLFLYFAGASEKKELYEMKFAMQET